MKIYTRTGDAGSTGLFGGPRVSKDDVRIEAYGTVDELNAALGLVRAAGVESEVDAALERIQSELFSVGAELASPDPDRHSLRLIGATHIAQLETWIDRFEADLAPLKQFILPGGHPTAAHLHLARGVCRRAERRVVTLSGVPGQAGPPSGKASDAGNETGEGGESHPNAGASAECVMYLNRLGDLLFVLARWCNHTAGVTETKWQKPSSDA
ncbi:cob(I)yrinic acid a,c-diamide adenosyltransferase [Roseimaritima sediminicola]|uniref:cob(I)yrinic acid a,c-diamide adenosyltransferase n=1 Tax=Roseimaritima sediminicola TaxID=2662066 RepID=UPI0012985673|nr:cob(I)yrinic acid a,c-diamide adenosyltransferase [Roseimaritima sediminicola]